MEKLIRIIRLSSKEGIKELKNTINISIIGKYTDFENTFKIVLKIGGINFYIILGEQKSGKIILLSCFVKDYREFEG